MNLYIIFGVMIFVFGILFYFYNKMINLKNLVEEAYSGIEVQMKKRFDLIPNLVSSVKEYMVYERDVLNKLTNLRTNALSGNISHDEYINLSNEAGRLLKSIMVSVENYPDLKAGSNMELLQRSLNEVEEQLAASRRAYNNAVKELNNGIEMVPTNIFAYIMRISKRNYLEIQEYEKENINISDLFHK